MFWGETSRGFRGNPWKGGVLLFETLDDKDLIESYQQSIELNLEKEFIDLLGEALRQRGLEDFVKLDHREMVNT